MLREILNKSKLFSVFHTEQRGDYHIALGQAYDEADWIAFIKMVLLRQEKPECEFFRIYKIQKQQLVNAWAVYTVNPEGLKQFVAEAVNKPQWLKNYKVVATEHGMRATLVGNPIDPPDPSVILGLSGQGIRR